MALGVWESFDCSGVTDRTSAGAVDVEVTDAVVLNIQIDFVGIVFSDDLKLIDNNLFTAFSTYSYGLIQYFVIKNDTLYSSLWKRITAAKIRQIAGGKGVVNLDESTIAINPDVLIHVGGGWLQIVIIMCCSNGEIHLKLVTIHHRLNLFEFLLCLAILPHAGSGY